MGAEYCVRPFLEEKSHLCDYRIATDCLASMLSVAKYHIRHISQKDLLQLMEMIYHVSGSIREACAIGEVELKKLSTFYARYHIEMDRFALLGGCTGVSHLHVLCVEIKAVTHIMHQIQCEGKSVGAILFDLMNLLSNTFFMVCLYENAQGGIREGEFISRPYV